MTPTAKLFTDNFTALATSAEGIAKLRELILQLAVQGKLVPQDSKDEPATKLLEKIQAEKAKLIKVGKLQNEKPLSPVKEDERPFLIPDSWVFSRMGNYTAIIMGQSPESKSYNNSGEGLPFYQGKSEYGKLYPSPKTWCTEPKKIAEKNDILISVRAPVGPTNICPGKSCIGRGLAAIRLLSDSEHFYILYTLRAFEKKIASQGVGSTFSAIGKEDLINFVIPIPPLAEQKRIVVKVDQLMALCDTLEQQLQQSQETHRQLNDSVIHHLLSAESEKEFAKTWKLICDNFDLLYNSDENVDKLRQAILQLAVQGKLVAQDPADEPADKLLEKIQAEKAKLIKEGKLKKQQPLLPIKNDEIPFDLPKGWQWTKMANATILITDGEHITPPRVPKPDVPLATAKNVRDGHLDLTVTDYVSSQTAQKCWQRCCPQHNDILIVCVGATTGRLCLLNEPPQIVIVRSVALLRTLQRALTPEYLALAIKSPLGQKQIWGKVKQSAQPCLYLNRINEIIAPIPPLAEQKRIVAKVDKLMALCDQLQERIESARTQAQQLTASTIHHLLAG